MTPPTDWAAWELRFEQFVRQMDPPADPAHDLAHVKRVAVTARRLAAAEGADLAVVLPAAWLHDCVSVAKDSPDRPRASALSAERAGRYLASAGYPPGLISAIEHAIAAHSFSAGIEPRTVEARVVQDADRLDALGAVGVARCLMLGGAYGRSLYAPHEPVPCTRLPDDRAYILDHFYLKLLRLADLMQTAAGKKEAAERTRFIREFVARLTDELRP